jgi:membrane protease YdiL (CAAX protease family)
MTERDQPPAGNEAQENSIPWSAMESWISVLLLALINVGLFVFISKNSEMQLAQSALVVVAELAYILPVVVILAWKRIPWRQIGFGKFDWGTMGIGCGMLIGGYGIIFVHNITLTLLGVDTQGQAFLDIFNSLDSPVWFMLAVVVIAPVVEEVFFRGFLFQGFRKKYGWVSAMLLSSGIFAAAHLDPVALVPTFVLGVVLTYVYHRSNSVWPGVILHFLVNASSTCSFYVLMQFPNLFPS